MNSIATEIGYAVIGVMLLFALAGLSVWIRDALKPKGRDANLR